MCEFLNAIFLLNFEKGLETLIAVVFCKECVLPVQCGILFCKGGEEVRGTDEHMDCICVCIFRST